MKLKELASAVYHLSTVSEVAKTNYENLLSAKTLRIDCYSDGRLLASFAGKNAESLRGVLLAELRQKIEGLQRVERYLMDGNFEILENVYQL